MLALGAKPQVPVIEQSPGYVLLVEPGLRDDASVLAQKIDHRLAELF